MAEDPHPLRIFLCHSLDDKQSVRELYQQLRADGFAPWLYKEDILPGQVWEREITKAVSECDIVLICLSRSSVEKKGFIHTEIKYALNEADKQPEDMIYLIPLMLEECAIPERLRRFQWVKLFETNGYEQLLRTLRHRTTHLSFRGEITQRDGGQSAWDRLAPVFRRGQEQGSGSMTRVPKWFIGLAYLSLFINVYFFVSSRKEDFTVVLSRALEDYQSQLPSGAQDKLYNIAGKIVNFNNSGIADVEVILWRNNDRPISARTNNKGVFYMNDIAPGEYSITYQLKYGQPIQRKIYTTPDTVTLFFANGNDSNMLLLDKQTGRLLP